MEANHLRQVERPKHKPTPTTVFKLAVLDAVFVSLTFQLRDFTNELYVWEKHWLGKECKTETYSRLKLRQRGLKLWCDQLKWLIFDIKLLVSTAENILAIKKCADLGGGYIVRSILHSYLMTWGKVSVDKLNKDISKREVKSLGFSSPSCKHTLSCSDKHPVSGSMV